MQTLAKQSGLGLAFTVLSFFALTSPLIAANISVGVINSEVTGLSLQRRGGYEIPTWHVSAYFQRREFIQVQSDVQHFFVPSFLQFNSFAGSLYAGLGLKVINYAVASDEEKYWLRIPLGLQGEIRPLRLQAFAELSLEAGPFPDTAMTSRPSLGVRVLL